MTMPTGWGSSREGGNAARGDRRPARRGGGGGGGGGVGGWGAAGIVGSSDRRSAAPPVRRPVGPSVRRSPLLHRGEELLVVLRPLHPLEQELDGLHRRHVGAGI